MKFFMIAAHSPNLWQRNAITTYFHGKPEYGFWHWTPDFWLITTSNYANTSEGIRNAIVQIAPGLHFAVFGADPRANDWAMFSNEKWAEWIRQNWPTF